ncbi:FAD-binding domain-containing protein [Mycena albidolilacea]|uniref:ferric-chelate reductase (NADPH) n=1 Tax=Mycena albidolilacea TaxID=1033008 RepID=A0AAD7EDA2_9AGAR|nr:FAD-binding domain-containing protein [Mycena albidolilacea]
MGLIWLKHPVLWHSSRVPSGYDYTAMTDAQKLLIVTRWHNWYTADWDYGQTTLAFFCAAILAAALLNGAAWIRARKGGTMISDSGNNLKKPGPTDKLTAALRYTTARQWRLRATRWYAPPLAAVLGVAGMCVFVMALLLGARPFYWPNEAMGHSPPIATRAGWISIAIMPFMIAFATKINFVALLTGTSHEKLQVFHRWSAVFMYITSLVHTFPFIINDIMMGEMVSQYKLSPWYWTGVAALVPQTYLIALSWGVFRNPYYEIFKKLHFIASGIFMAALFIHVNFRLTSWDYFWATLALYVLAWLARVGRTLYTTRLGLPATLTSVGPDLVRLSVCVPAGRMKWAPGQHVFVRALGLGVHALTSHPFTISSLHSGEGKEEAELELVMRVHGGLTHALARRVAGKAAWATRVVVDGPYGGLHVPLQAYERVYLLAGGSGATFTLPIFANLAATLKAGGVSCQRIEFVVAVPDGDNYAWMEPAVTAAAAQLPDTAVGVRVHYTRIEEPTKGSESDASVDALRGRPVLGDIVREAHASARKVAIVACGPDEFLYDVRSAVAESQLVIADGFGTCKDMFLHTETYSW